MLQFLKCSEVEVENSQVEDQRVPSGVSEPKTVRSDVVFNAKITGFLRGGW